MIHIVGEKNNKFLGFMLFIYNKTPIYMLEFSKKILKKVSFDKTLFKKELFKSIGWVGKKDMMALKIWALATFSQYRETILEVFDTIS